MNTWESVRSLLNYSVYDVNLGRMAAAALAFMLILTLRTLLTRAVFSFAGRLASKTKTTFDNELLEILRPPVKFLFIPLALRAAASILQVPPDGAVLVGHLVRSLVIGAFIWVAYRAASSLAGHLEPLVKGTETQIDDHLLPIARKSIRVLVVVIGVVTLIQEWGYDVGALLAGLGLGGLAFALAARDTVSNLFGCIMILSDHPFKIGDWIKTPSVEGTVEEIGFRSTKVRTFAQAQVTVPNAQLANESIMNWTRMGKRRITYKLGVTYRSTGEQLKECIRRIEEMLRRHPDVHQGTIFVQFDGFGDSALELFLYFFTTTTVWGEYLRVRTDVNLKIMGIIEELGMSVAFPSRSLYIEETAAAGRAMEALDRLADQSA